MFTFKRNHQFNHRWNLKTLRRIGEDLRKAGAITGVGFVGLVLPNDNIGLSESLLLALFGILSWGIGLYLEYVVDTISPKSRQSFYKRNRKTHQP
ncbi:hypothetical protein QP016_10835 [Gallibacterium anatis]|uniref:hypothetical protein n=1 Tax=Gallibacterium anatis TaxID=750 RepID=UPI00254B48E6|nr:hypothetical protein [Gallibacterium anatis]MDK9431213.1 hypothetical protein [Gallibacterium anatis]